MDTPHVDIVKATSRPTFSVDETRHPLFRPDMIRVTFATEDQTAEWHKDLPDVHDFLIHAVQVASAENRPHHHDAPGMWYAEWLAALKNALGPALCVSEWYAETIAELDELARAPRLGEVGKKVYVWVNCCGVIRGNFPGRDVLGRPVFRLKRGGGGGGGGGGDVLLDDGGVGAGGGAFEGSGGGATAGGDALVGDDVDMDAIDEL